MIQGDRDLFGIGVHMDQVQTRTGPKTTIQVRIGDRSQTGDPESSRLWRRGRGLELQQVDGTRVPLRLQKNRLPIKNESTDMTLAPSLVVLQLRSRIHPAPPES